MEITIHLLSKKIDSDYKKALDEYIKRCTFFSKINIKTYKKESVPAIQSSSRVFIVTVNKDTISSTELATIINDTCVSGYSKIEFIIPDGLDISKLEINEHISELGFLSLNLENELKAVALTEQIYRAFTILNNITYHK